LKKAGIIVLLVLLILIGIPLILLNTSYFQRRLVDSVAKELSLRTGTKIYIEDSDIDLFRGIVFHHVQVDDSLKHRILKAERLDIGVRILPLLRKQVELESLRIIRGDICLSRKTPESDLNIQSIINAFKSDKKSVLPWHIDINSVVLRNCRIRYDILSKPYILKGLDVNHLDFYNVSAKLGLKISPHNHFQLRIYKLQAKEKCGLKINKLKFQVKLSDKGFNLKDFELLSSHSTVEISEFNAKYSSLSAFSSFADSVKFDQTTIKINVIPSDFAYLNTSLANMSKPVDLSIAIQGKFSDLTCNKLRVNIQNMIMLDARFALKGLPVVKDLNMKGQIEMLRILPEGLEYLSGIITKKFTKIPALHSLGTVNYMGLINTVNHRWIVSGDFATDAGNVGTNLQLSKENSNYLYEGKINANDFKLSMLFPEKKTFGKVSFDLSVKLLQDINNKISGMVDGKIPYFYYNGYNYQNLALNGEFNDKGFNGKASLNDINAKLNFVGLVDFSNHSPKFKFDLNAVNVNLQPFNLTNKVGSPILSFHMHSDFEGRVVDDLQGSVSIDSLYLYKNQEHFYLNHLDLLAGKNSGSKHILISSNLINGEIQGDYKFSTLAKSLQNLAKSYFPSLFKPELPDYSVNNNFTFNCTLLPSASLAKILDLPFVMEDKLDIQGFYNNRTGKFRIKGNIPKLTYGKTLVESVGFLLENPQNEAKFLAYAQIGSGGKEVKLNIDARSFNDKTTLKFDASNSSASTYSGNIQSDIHFSRRVDGKFQIDANLKKSDIILNDSVWTIHPTDLRWEEKRLYVNDFQLTNASQFIKIQGYASDKSSDTLSVAMKSFSLDDLFLILPKSQANIHFGGRVSGHAECVRLLKNPAMNADLSVDDFSFNHAVLGHLTAKSKWNNAMKALALDAEVRSNEEIDGVHRKIVTATGAFFPASDSMFLSIDADRVPVGFLDPYLGKILNQMKGVVSGNVHLIGPMKNLGLYAQAYAENVSFGVQLLNTRYHFSDSVLISPRIVVFRNVEVKDKEGNVAVATGLIRHSHFKNMRTSIDIQTKKLLAMDIPPSSNAYFYGTAYGSGSVKIEGLKDKVQIDVNMRTEDKTKATISLHEKSEVVENSFVNFIQKKKVNEDYDIDLKTQPIPLSINTPTNLTVNLQVDAAPNAELTLITDLSSGDEIKARGNGAIRAEFSDDKDLQLYGRYTIENGSYKFIYQNLLRRDFTIEKGGNINFSGDPFTAELDIKANYTVNAKLSDLLPTEELSSLNLNRSSIPVNCVLKLDGELQKPGIQLDLAYPSADDDLKKQIANVINTDEMVNQQIVFLMLFGRFNAPTYSTAVQSSTSNMSTALNTTISTVSAQLNNMINDVFGQSKMSFDFDYRNATYETNTPGEWNVGMSGQWFDNRLTFNGNLGSRENLTETNKNQFIGEFDVNLKFKNSEKWSARFYNKANDNRYFKSALNTQGLGIVYKEDYNKISDLFKQMVESLKKPFQKKR
jgi:hypothetical protein